MSECGCLAQSTDRFWFINHTCSQAPEEDCTGIGSGSPATLWTKRWGYRNILLIVINGLGDASFSSLCPPQELTWSRSRWMAFGLCPRPPPPPPPLCGRPVFSRLVVAYSSSSIYLLTLCQHYGRKRDWSWRSRSLWLLRNDDCIGDVLLEVASEDQHEIKLFILDVVI